MAKYIPKFNEDNKKLLILDSVFDADDCLEYADKHNMSILFTNTTSTDSVNVILQFQKRGFNHTLYEKSIYAPDGTELEPKILCLFEKSKVKETIDKI